MKQKKCVLTLALLCFVYALFLAATVFSGQKTYSDTERRKLQTLPAVSVSSVASGKFMSDFEGYSLDQFPERDLFRALKAAVQLDVLRQKDNNKLYRVDGSLAKLEYPLDEDSLAHAAEVFEKIADKQLTGTDAKVYFSVVPDKNAFLAPENGYPHLDYDALIASLCRKLTDMTYIDVTDCLSLEDYYRTDPHWRQEQINDVAERLLSAMGAPSGFSYEPQTLEQPFYGVYAGQLALPAAPDSLTVLISAVLDGCSVYDWENGREIPVYDLTRADGRDPYELYLSGPLSLITIENPACESDRELVIFRDSFGSSIAPLLAEAYAKITLVDVRYLASDALGQFLSFDDQDVLFLYSTLVLNNSAGIK